MPIKIDRILSAGLYTIDGEKVLDLTDTEADQFYENEESQNNIKLIVPDLSFNIKLSFGAIRRLNKVVYGWKAKGPIRRKLLRKLWGLE